MSRWDIEFAYRNAPRWLPPKAGMFHILAVSSRLGTCKSAWLSNWVGRGIHDEYKKLEGPLQKAALVLTVYTFEPAAAEKIVEDNSLWPES